MRERAITTSIIWIALAFSISFMLDSVRYTELVVSPVDSTQLIEQTAFVSTAGQIGAGILIFMLIGCAMGATIAIWESGKTAHQADKAKRQNRDARLKRLLATMDDEDLDMLEGIRLGDDGEQMPLEVLLKRRD